MLRAETVGEALRENYRMNRPPRDLDAESENTLSFEMLLTELSAHFVSVTSESIDFEIVDAQRRIVQALDLDRSTLAQLEGGEGFVITHAWHLPGLEPFPRFAVKDLPWMSSAIMRGEVVCFARIDEMPAEAVHEKELARWQRAQHIKEIESVRKSARLIKFPGRSPAPDEPRTFTLPPMLINPH
jgi:hypothetical protein